jgi:SAM-dependent methyltransferase
MPSRGARATTSRPRAVQRLDELVALSAGRSVLHLGCTNWPYTAESERAGTLLHRSLADAAGELTGLDSDPAGLAALRDLGYDRLVLGDLEHLDDAMWFGTTDGDDRGSIGPFDVVIAGEVLEHLGAPAALLAGVRPLLGPSAELVITVPNAYCAFRFASYALSRRRGNPEPVHPDHVAYYSEATLTHLLDDAGYDVVELCFYDLGREHRPSAPRSWRVVNDVAMRVAPQLADGVLARCRPRTS